MQAATKKTKPRRESVTRKKSDKTDATSAKPVSVKRSIKVRVMFYSFSSLEYTTYFFLFSS